MGITLYSAGGGMILEERRQQTVARNLASSNIPGYKREYVTSHQFASDLQDQVNSDESQFLGTTNGTIRIDHSQGALRPTERPLDFVIQGDGFFEVKTQDGQKLYTRNGNFHMDNNRQLVTAEGYVVSAKTGGRIQFNIDDNVNDIQCTTDGYIRINEIDTGTTREIGQFKVVDCKDRDAMIRLTAKYFTVSKDNQKLMFQPTPLNPTEGENPFNFQITNGYEENPNTSVVKDMAELIQCTRNYEMNYKIVKMLAERGQAENRNLT